MFAAEQISKSFRLKNGGTLKALGAVSLAVRPGGITALVGPDGAGKSTLLRIIAGLLRPDSGRLVFNGRALDENSADARADIGYMPQRFGLYEDLTVQENLDLYADLKGVSLADRESRYRELLAMSAMEPFRGRLASRLSGGMKQKLGLICTLVAPPKLLLLDEPTVGVDPLSRRELWEIVERLTGGSGMSVIVSTSYLDEAARCGEVALLFEGATLARGAPESIRGRTEGMSYLADPMASPAASPVPVKNDQSGTSVMDGTGDRVDRGDTPRSLQARLLGAPGIIDAVPQGGSVRFVHGPLNGEEERRVKALLRGASVRPVSATLEDSFMLLLHEHMRKNGGNGPDESGDKRGEREERNGRAGGVSSHPPPYNGADAKTDGIAPGSGAAGNDAAIEPQLPARNGLAAPEPEEPAIETKNVSRFFGDFIAVNDVSFSVRRGEVFGLLGPNGAGKTTTFRMLCGLLPASRGTLRVAGVDVRGAREEARRHLGYVAQKFSLYGPMSVLENLDFFAGAYGLRGAAKERRIRAVTADFSLERHLHAPAESLPGGYRQRLAMAVGLLHEPAILFLDEPTSGADPLARRDFWKRISRLADSGVTIVVTTHFMEEAEYCDRVLIQDSGVMLALGAPGDIRALAEQRPGVEPAMEDAFIDIVAKARKKNGMNAPGATPGKAPDSMPGSTPGAVPVTEAALPASVTASSSASPPTSSPVSVSAPSPASSLASSSAPAGAGNAPSPSRARALIRKEGRQMLRDKSTLTLGIFLPILLLLLFGFGLSLDVQHVPVTVVRDSSSPVTRDVYAVLRLSPYFNPSMADSWREAEGLLRAGKTDAIVRRALKDRPGGDERIQVIVNGRDSNTARIMQRYLEGALAKWDGARRAGISFSPGPSTTEGAGRAVAEPRVWYNHALESRFFLVPGVTALIMTLIGSLLTALVVAREWERGTYEALAATPATRREIVAGKTVPYFALGMIGLSLCLAASYWVFGVPMRGSLVLIVAGSAVYLLVSLGIGLFISATVKNQFLASQIVLIFSFLPTLMLSGFIFDLKSAPVIAYYLAHVFPATWYVDLLQTLFLVGDIPGTVGRDMLVLSGFAVCLLGMAGAKIQKSLE